MERAVGVAERLAGRRHRCGSVLARRSGRGHRAGEFGDLGFDGGEGLAGCDEGLAGVLPQAQAPAHFGIPDTLCEIAVALRHAFLAAQAGVAGFEVLDDDDQLIEIPLRTLETQVGLVAARLQTGNSGRFLEEMAAVGRLAVDDVGNVALVHQGRTRCA